jgi:hypothetical protein
MRRRLRKSVQPGVSLFPFLAVLICTLGVLIVLLVLAAKSASIGQAEQQASIEEDAAAKAAAELATQKRQQAIIEKLEDQVDINIIASEGFESIRPEAQRKLAAAREYRAHLEKELIEIEDQAKQLAAELKLLDSDLEAVTTEIDESAVTKLRKQIAAAEDRLATKRSSVVTVEQKKFAIVPYRGAGGTKRIPIFIECNNQGLVLQPWNIPLSTKDFFHPVGAGNPVDAALMAVRNYYQKYELAKDNQRPYPLLVIRPDGAQSYGLARRSLVSWDDEFGYELVSSEKDLDFGTSDPQLENEIRSAIEKAKQNQIALMRRKSALAKARRGMSGDGFAGEAGSSGGSRGRGGLRASSQHGGFVRESGFVHEGGSSQRQGQQVAYQGSNSNDANSNIASNMESGSASVANASGEGNDNAKGDQQSSGDQASGSASPSQVSIANARGANWALPTETSGATGYVRPVSLTCSADSLTLKNVAGDAVTIPIGAQPTQAIDRMVNIIWQRIDSWGIAGSNAFWKPNLAVTVRPGGEQQFKTIKEMLNGSGLGVEEVQR